MAMVISPAHEAFRMDFDAWLAQKAGSMLVKWTCLRDVVMKSGGFTAREAIAFMKVHGLEQKGVMSNETHLKNLACVSRGGQVIRLRVDWADKDAPAPAPAPVPVSDLLMKFVAAFAIDTRMGIMCLQIADGVVSLDLKRLGLAVTALAPSFMDQFRHCSVRLVSPMVLSPEDLLRIREAADSGCLSDIERKPKCIFQTLRLQSVRLGDPCWGRTVLKDTAAPQQIADILAAISGQAIVDAIVCHVRSSFRPTCQALRTLQEYSDDVAILTSAAIGGTGTEVEEMQVFAGGAFVPRPPRFC